MIARIIGYEDGMFLALDEDEGKALVTKAFRDPTLKVGDYILAHLLSDNDDKFYFEFYDRCSSEQLQNKLDIGGYDHLTNDGLLR